jgi:hypothetical protein
MWINPPFTKTQLTIYHLQLMLAMKQDYGTLSETINGLKGEGYVLDFNLQNDLLVCTKDSAALSADDFEIDAVFRFEGESNPDDESVVYAISSTKNNAKGLLVNAFGIYANGTSDALIAKLQRHR